MNHATRTIAATLIAASALFGLSPTAGAEPSAKDQTSSQTADSPKPATKKAPAPASRVGSTTATAPAREFPAGTPRWVKRIVKRIDRFVQSRPSPTRPYEPGQTNIVCRLQGTC